MQPGWKDGTKITFPGKGDEVPGRPPADLVFVVKQLPHPLFERRGNDLHLKATITLKQAIGGGCCPRQQAMPVCMPCLCSCMAAWRVRRGQTLVWVGGVWFSDVQEQSTDAPVHHYVGLPRGPSTSFARNSCCPAVHHHKLT